MKVFRACSLLVSGLAWLALACGGEPATIPVSAKRVAVVTVRNTDLEDQIEANGELVAPNRAEIAAEVNGRVTQLLLPEGSAVERDQVVVEIDPERRKLETASARAALQETQASLQEQERDFTRVRQLYRNKVASRTRRDQAETTLTAIRARVGAAQARLGIAERALRNATVRAPFSGRIVRRHVSAGEYVRTGQKLFEMVALDPLEVEFSLAETRSSRVRIGNPVELRLAPFPDEIFRARVSFLSPVIDSQTRTLRIKARLENPQDRLRPGLFARVDLGLSLRKNIKLIPEEAVLEKAKGPVVFRLRGSDRVEQRPIETGIHRKGMVEAIDGLDAGDHIVIRGQNDLVDGARVQVMKPPLKVSDSSASPISPVATSSPETPAPRAAP